MSNCTKVSTRFEWFDAAGKLLRVDEVEGDGSFFRLDPETGTVHPINLEAPMGSARVVTRPVVIIEGDE